MLRGREAGLRALLRGVRWVRDVRGRFADGRGADERGGGRRAETRRADEQGRARQDDLVVVRSSRGEIRRRGEWVGRAGRAADVGGDLGRERLRRRRRSREKVDVMRSLVP